MNKSTELPTRANNKITTDITLQRNRIIKIKD